MTVGSELRQAREAAGLSAEQISERTKIQLYKIEALERDDFERLPQGIYLDGIVRAYAHEVGIDVEPMVERMRTQRGKLPGDWEVPFDAPIDLHGPASHTNSTAPDDIPMIDVPVIGDPLSSFATESDLRLSHIPEQPPAVQEPNVVQIPVPADHRQRRMGAALPVLALLGSLGIGFYLYQRGLVNDEPVPYSENAVTPDQQREPPVANPAVSTQEPSTSPGEAATPDRAAQPEAVTQPPEQQRAESMSPPATPAPSIDVPTKSLPIETTPSTDVTGSWRVATHVESSSLTRYEGLKLGYEIQLEQEGDRVKGHGRKVTENGTGIGTRAQTPLTVSGTIEGDRLTLNFVERGTRRPTQGKFVLLVDDSSTLRGRFSSSAARSTGRVEAHRVTTQ